MTKIGFAFALVFGLSIGCGGGDKIGSLVKELEAHKAKVCACKDKGCADKANADYEKWKEGLAKVSEADLKKATKEQDQKFDDLDDAISACVKKFDAPAGGEPAPAPAPTP